jgi:hypothetical protein
MTPEGTSELAVAVEAGDAAGMEGESDRRGEAPPSSRAAGGPWLPWIIGACCLTIVAAPILIRARPAPVSQIAIVGGAVAVLVGLVLALIIIKRTHGMPFGDRDPAKDRSSPYLRRASRMGFVMSLGTIAFALCGLAFASYWYPRPDPYIAGVTAETFVLGPLILCLVLLGGGVCVLTLQLYWARIVAEPRSRQRESQES